MKNLGPHWFVLILVISLGFNLGVSVSASADEKKPIPDSATARPMENGVIAYYFHGNVRCATCRKLEAYSNEAIVAGFPEEIESDKILWLPVNVDESANAHFVDDFQLVTKALVLVEYRDGKMTRWENLDKIWTLVRDQEKFVSYVEESIRAFLQE